MTCLVSCLVSCVEIEREGPSFNVLYFNVTQETSGGTETGDHLDLDSTTLAIFSGLASGDFTSVPGVASALLDDLHQPNTS